MHAVDIAGRSIVTPVTSSATETTLVGPNMNRRGLLVFNNASTAMLIKYGAGASANSFTGHIVAGALWEMPRPIFVGQVTAIWDGTPSGDCQVTELL